LVRLCAAAILMASSTAARRTKFAFPAAAGMGSVKAGGTADWLGKAARRAGGARSLLAAAVSSDGVYLAVGGGDRKVHVWDVRSRQHVQVRAQTLSAFNSVCLVVMMMHQLVHEVRGLPLPLRPCCSPRPMTFRRSSSAIGLLIQSGSPQCRADGCTSARVS